MGRVSGVLAANGITLAEKPKREVLALDREFAEMEKQIKVLDAKCLKLEAQIKPLENEVERLKQQQYQGNSESHALAQDAVELMRFIGERRSVTAKDIRDGMGTHSVQVEYLLGSLMESKHIDQSNVPMVGAMYSLSTKGNGYLIKNKLVPLRGAAGEQPSNPKGHHCDHCGSQRLRRTGSRPDPTFSEVGVKQALYNCLDCGKESGFTNDEATA